MANLLRSELADSQIITNQELRLCQCRLPPQTLTSTPSVTSRAARAVADATYSKELFTEVSSDLNSS